MQFKIGNRALTSKDPYIIAEIGSNWERFDHAKDSIALAKNCGADAVKFQLFTHRALYGWDGPVLPGQIAPDWLPKLKEKADAEGIEFMCSAFSPQLMDEVDKFVNVHKIASSNMADITILDRVAKFNKPTFVSTGGWPHGDVLGTKFYLDNKRFKDFCFMYTVSDYPSKFANFHYFNKLKKSHAHFGFSDHTTNVFPLPRDAVLNGAIVVEKHFNPFDLLMTPDAPHSLGIEDFKLMVKGIKGEINEDFKGRGETEMRLKSLVRVVAIERMQAGDALILDRNFGVHRSTHPSAHGAHPANVYKMEGKKLLVPKLRGEGISLKDIEPIV